MIQQQINNYIKTFLKGWLLCESCSNAEMNNSDPNYELIVECNACSQVCFDIASRLLLNDDNIGDLPFNCMVHCRQCIDECEKYDNYGNATIKACVVACKNCARVVKELASFSLN